MSEPTTIHDTFVIERSFAKPPARVFAALADPALKRRWYADGKTHHTDAYEMDFRVGGAETSRYRMSETTPFPGVEMASDGIIEDIVPDQRVVISSTMSIGGRRISSSLVTFELVATAAGCDLICTHQAAFYEGADGPQRRHHGWGELLTRLDHLLTAA
jgi:uncharacterized protein YndB with AHSA1/START domain